MGELTRQTTIAAPIQSVFDYVADAHNAPNYINSITRIISGPQEPPAAGQRWQADANFLGSAHRVTLRLAELHPPTLVRYILEGDPRAMLVLRLAPDGSSQTHVSLSLAVPSVPSILVNGLMGGLLTSDMVRLKRILESKT